MVQASCRIDFERFKHSENITKYTDISFIVVWKQRLWQLELLEAMFTLFFKCLIDLFICVLSITNRPCIRVWLRVRRPSINDQPIGNFAYSYTNLSFYNRLRRDPNLRWRFSQWTPLVNLPAFPWSPCLQDLLIYRTTWWGIPDKLIHKNPCNFSTESSNCFYNHSKLWLHFAKTVRWVQCSLWTSFSRVQLYNLKKIYYYIYY